MDAIEPGKVPVRAVQDVEAPGFDRDLIEKVDLVNLSLGDENDRRDVAP